MGIFGGSAQDDVDLREVKDRLARVESALASLQAQVATLTTGAPAGAPAGAPGGVAAGAPPQAPEEVQWLGEVRRLKDSGKLINAIKVYREHTGAGLKESKDAVEAM